MKTLIDKLLIAIAAVSSLLALLMQGGFLDARYKPQAAAIAILSLILETIWKLLGKPASDAKSAAELVTQALNSLSNMVSENKRHTFRACLMRPNGLFVKKLRVKYRSSSMQNAPHRDIKFEKWQGWAGQCWGSNKPLGIDRRQSGQAGSPQLPLTPELEALTHDIRLVVSIPVRHPADASKVIGVLCVDTPSNAKYLLDKPHVERIQTIALLIASILVKLDQA